MLSLWSGTGLKVLPGGPANLYQRGNEWYLMIAEGGTERGHSVSIARGASPEGPFEGHSGQPDPERWINGHSGPMPVQNTGHADLVETPNGGSALVMLGMRPLGATQSFSPLGRETFITEVTLGRTGWPAAEPVMLSPRQGIEEEVFDFGDAAALDDPGWMTVRALPSAVATLTERPGWLTITGDGSTLDGLRPRFVGRRQRHLTATVATTVDASAGSGGLACRYDEPHHLSLEARGSGASTVVTVLASLAGLRQSWEITVPAGDVEFRMEMAPAAHGFSAEAMGGDRIRLIASAAGEEHQVTELDGRYWTAEMAASFTGRVVGLYAVPEGHRPVRRLSLQVLGAPTRSVHGGTSASFPRLRRLDQKESRDTRTQACGQVHLRPVDRGMAGP